MSDMKLTNQFGSNQNTLRMPTKPQSSDANPNMSRGPTPVAPMTNQVRSNVMSGQSFANSSPGRKPSLNSASKMVGGYKSNSSQDMGTRPTVQVQWTAPSQTSIEEKPYTGVTFSPTVREPEKIVTYGRPEDLMNDFVGNTIDQNLLDTLAQYQGIYDPEGYDLSQLDIQMVQDDSDPTGLRFLLTDSEGNVISRLRRYTIPGMEGYSQFTFEGGPTYSPIASDSTNAFNRSDSLLNVFGITPDQPGQTEDVGVIQGGTEGEVVNNPGRPVFEKPVGGSSGEDVQQPPAEQSQPDKQTIADNLFNANMYKPGSIASVVPDSFNSPAEARAFYFTTRARIINSNWSPEMKGMAMRELNAILNSPEYPNAYIGGSGNTRPQATGLTQSPIGPSYGTQKPFIVSPSRPLGR